MKGQCTTLDGATATDYLTLWLTRKLSPHRRAQGRFCVLAMMLTVPFDRGLETLAERGSRSPAKILRGQRYI